MRALVFDGQLEFSADYSTPEPNPDEALIRVSYAGICATDLEITKGYMGFKGIPGHEFIGIVEKCADESLIGKRIAGEINLWCGSCEFCIGGNKTHCPNRTVLGIYKKDGVFADYVTLPVRNLHLLPDSISYLEAVFIEPLAAAFEILEQVEVKDKKVCVIGDGRLGLLCAQVLALTGCRLTTIGRHPEKLSILKNRGLRTRDNADGLVREFDVVVDCTGSNDGLNEALRIVKPRGNVVLKTTVADRGTIDLNQIVIDEITITGSRCGPFGPAIKALAEKRVDVMPLVDRIFPVEEGLAAFDHAAKKGVLKTILRF